MSEPENPLIAFSDHAARLVAAIAGATVSVRAGGRTRSSGIHWRSGVIVTAEEILDADDDIKVTLPDGRQVAAALAGRDPTTDVAVLRFQPDGLPVAPTADGGWLRAGHVVLAVGQQAARRSRAWASSLRSAAPGTACAAARSTRSCASTCGSPWAAKAARSSTPGTRARHGRRRAARPRAGDSAATIDRAVDHLLAKGYVARGYLGAGLQPLRSAKRRASWWSASTRKDRRRAPGSWSATSSRHGTRRRSPACARSSIGSAPTASATRSIPLSRGAPPPR